MYKQKRRISFAIAILFGFAGMVIFLNSNLEINGNVIAEGYNSDVSGSLFGLAFVFISLLITFYAVHLKKKEVNYLLNRKR
ncbi:MAG TPA: hypothetical protein P5277_00595 [Candidatus Paceibacterota bacterium]|nr:hypothetical protein [Candidatus Paceibacterota bacterium]